MAGGGTANTVFQGMAYSGGMVSTNTSTDLVRHLLREHQLHGGEAWLGANPGATDDPCNDGSEVRLNGKVLYLL